MLFLGGHRITGAGWLGYRGVYVDFATQFSSGWLWQLYANRTLIGRTSSPLDRRVLGQLVGGDVPAPLTLVRVDPANATTDYGPRLPRLPWNRFGLNWAAASFPADSAFFDITGSRVAGGLVDSANLIARVPFDGDGAYSYVLPVIDDSGVWSYAVTSRDDALPLGNPGTVATVSVTALVPPPDVEVDSQGNRFELAIDSGDVVASFIY